MKKTETADNLYDFIANNSELPLGLKRKILECVDADCKIDLSKRTEDK